MGVAGFDGFNNRPSEVIDLALEISLVLGGVKIQHISLSLKKMLLC